MSSANFIGKRMSECRGQFHVDNFLQFKQRSMFTLTSVFVLNFAHDALTELN